MCSLKHLPRTPDEVDEIVKRYTVPPQSRFNIWVNQQDAGFAATDVSAVRTASVDRPIIVERAMYLDAPGRALNAGHESAGVTTPSLNWFVAEGATGAFFDLFVLIANRSATGANVTATYLLPSGSTVTKGYSVSANSRFNVCVRWRRARTLRSEHGGVP